MLTTTPAYALFGSILAGIQRAKMMVIIYLTLQRQVYNHQFIGAGLSWKNDFTGVAGELAGAVEQLARIIRQ